ncbi:hypothetical protein KUTeg_003381 [Tegillarca granosa]|uniref:Uncharacterized protein n=1 Tax=Tegillarca granosa TaxID=220873 RepID=A0ABQ9FLZ6_TEGGR|nr:hypothetical protein KUTeg_003381 [Tegillarca granosa]
MLQNEEETQDRSEIRKIRNDVEETKGALHDVLVKIRDRDGKLPLLEKKAYDVHRMMC